MKKRHIVLTLVSMFVVYSVNAEDLSVSITSTKENEAVSQRHYLSGNVSDPNAQVWVVIHPVETSGFWVQPPVTVKNDGSWRVNAYFGRAGKDQGKAFEVRAFANPDTQLREGRLDSWPNATARSNVVAVVRE